MHGQLGVAIVGLGGAVASTAAAGIELLKLGKADETGLPLGDLPGLVPYTGMTFGGWDLYAEDLLAAAKHHKVLDRDQIDDAEEALAKIKPWPAMGDASFCSGVDGEHRHGDLSHREKIDCLIEDLVRFREESGGSAVLINLASVERTPDRQNPIYHIKEAFEAALDASDPEISPAMLYAYAAIKCGVPYGNFTPSFSGDVPALIAMAEEAGVPLAGKDGKTGQTFMKTVLAPAFRDRALRIDGWYSTNILGNRDGEALNEPNSLASKIETKGDVLNSIVGYDVGSHLVQINYYKPRGDEKEAWDNIDVSGFLGRPMQIKLNFLCRDSVLAAPLVIEIARCLDLAKRRGEGGILEPLGVFFKAPMTQPGQTVQHAFPEQQAALQTWLAGETMQQSYDAARAAAE
ncbi:inositol-3-phosphate synthase [Parvularcula maris]|uniref:inositol-3-phosphate synthase n=1 Tax=Parvularcula maris TaxID=2965077 RepID=UPI00273AEABD|nr:inositol-3-phosphate synthase [Parvularcula maris]